MVSNRRVVITGMGVITPLGLDVETMWQSLLAGESAADVSELFDTSGFLTRIFCEVRAFDPLDYMDRRDARRFDRFTQFAVAATNQAVDQACLSSGPVDTDTIGVIVGSGYGGLGTIELALETLNSKGPMRVSPPLAGATMLPNMAAGQIAMTLGLRGPNRCLVSACSSGTTALISAYKDLYLGDAEVMIAGGVDACITRFMLYTHHRLGALSQRNDDPKRASRPFDAKRDGFVMGEGAGIVVMESLEHARARGARPLAEVIGYGESADANEITAPPEDGAGLALAMRKALGRADIRPEDVDYINAHATSTLLGDLAETRGLKAVFDDHAYNIPVSATKSMIGHLLGAAGAVEAIVCVRTLQEGIIHPTINYEYPDPECDLYYVPNEPRRADVRVALSNSAGFGGHNASIILGQVDDE
ncbi:MAG: beta-ketoacyl-ACP synthase II [Anaerolineae bacterium]